MPSRLGRAQELLQNDRLAVSQVAALLGYPSAASTTPFSPVPRHVASAWREAGGRSGAVTRGKKFESPLHCVYVSIYQLI